MLSYYGLTKTELKGKNLSFYDLRGVDLSWQDLTNTDFRSAKLEGANLCGAKLCGADLSNAHLEGANMASVDLTNADLINADLRKVNLSGAILSRANFRGADLDYSCLSDTKGKAIISLGGIGCDNELIYYVIDDNHLSFEDFKGTLREFEEFLTETYEEDNLHYKEVTLALETLKKFKELYNEER